MRVLHVLPAVAPVYGGPSHAIGPMTGGLAALGVEVDIATTNAAGDIDLDVPTGVPIERDGVRTYYFARVGRGSYRFSWPLTRWLLGNTERYDVVHMHGVFTYSTFGAASAARRARRPYIVRPLGSLDGWSLGQKRWKKAPYYQLVERANLEHASAIHATSDAEAVEIGRLGLHRKVVIVPLGVPIPTSPRPSRTTEISRDAPLELLFLSRIHPKKGLMVLLDAMKELVWRQVPVRLTIAGNPEDGYERVVDERIAALGLGGVVVRAAYVAGDAKAALFARSDLFVLPSYQENFGIAVAEALGNGLPAIVTDAVALAAEVSRAGAGSVVPVDDPKGLATAIARYVDATVRRTAETRARSLAEEQFGVDARARDLVALYQSILRLC